MYVYMYVQHAAAVLTKRAFPAVRARARLVFPPLRRLHTQTAASPLRRACPPADASMMRISGWTAGVGVGARRVLGGGEGGIPVYVRTCCSERGSAPICTPRASAVAACEPPAGSLFELGFGGTRGCARWRCVPIVRSLEIILFATWGMGYATYAHAMPDALQLARTPQRGCRTPDGPPPFFFKEKKIISSTVCLFYMRSRKEDISRQNLRGRGTRTDANVTRAKPGVAAAPGGGGGG